MLEPTESLYKETVPSIWKALPESLLSFHLGSILGGLEIHCPTLCNCSRLAKKKKIIPQIYRTRIPGQTLLSRAFATFRHVSESCPELPKNPSSHNWLTIHEKKGWDDPLQASSKGTCAYKKFQATWSWNGELREGRGDIHFTLISCRFRDASTTIEIRVHFDCTSMSLRLYFVSTIRYQFMWTSIPLRLHFDFMSLSFRAHFGLNPI